MRRTIQIKARGLDVKTGLYCALFLHLLVAGAITIWGG